MATIVGTKFSDTLKGAGEADYIFGFESNDSIFGRGGDDDIKGGGGADFLDGGAGIDTARYDDSESGVRVDLLSSFGVGGTAEGDRYAGIENVVGSMHSDTLIGDNGANMLFGGAGYMDGLHGAGGDDLLIGGPGADYMRGGDGIDTASYESATGPVQVFLEFHVGSGNDALADQLYEIENVTGSRFDDQLSGDANSNVLQGMDGNDYLYSGNDGGNDTLIGGAGYDTLRGNGADIMIGGLDGDHYWVNNVNDQVIEAAGEGLDTVHALIDYTLAANVENAIVENSATVPLRSLTGNALDNTLIGHAGTNIIDGGYGKDTMAGGGGVDVFIWSSVDEIGHFNFDPDIVTDYNSAQGDLLHFTNMDADATIAGNQDFTFIGTAAFTAPGQINWVTNGTDTFIQLNTDADLTADGTIQLNGVLSGDSVLMFL